MKSPVTEDMDIRKINLEHALYLAAFLLALAVRFVNLGAMALPDAEANWALQALQLAHSGPLKASFAWGPQPGYLILTGLTFALFGAENGLARLWPALVGSLLVLMPFFFRRDLGKPAALILAFGLALDPGLAAVSRQAGGSMLALTFVLLALGAWRIRQPLLAGVCAALALLGGPSILLGVLGLALAWGAALLLGRAFGWQPDSVDEEMLSSESSPAGSSLAGSLDRWRGGDPAHQHLFYVRSARPGGLDRHSAGVYLWLGQSLRYPGGALAGGTILLPAAGSDLWHRRCTPRLERPGALGN